MYDIRFNKEVIDKAVRFADPDQEVSYLQSEYDTEGGVVVGVYNGNGDLVFHLIDDGMAGNLVDALTYAIDNQFWEE